MKTVFSGIQPTGNLHLGNYLGSVKNWIDLQDQHKCFFGIMNLHAITVFQDPKELQKNVLDCAITYLACGLNPEKSTIFVQSQVPQHTELAWLLGTITPLGWLNRMTQFKDKSQKQEENTNLGLYAYPTLMAADILLYKADLVPVGQDQKQHLELCRDIAGAFNHQVKQEYFKLPEPLIFQGVERIMSLTDGLNKMSKSDESDYSRINLTDSPELIVKKFKKAKTDSNSVIEYDKNRPEIYNLLNIFAAATCKEAKEIANQYQNSGYGKFKTDLADSAIAMLAPIQKNIENLSNNLDYVEEILEKGRLQAQEIAFKNKTEIFQLFGLK